MAGAGTAASRASASAADVTAQCGAITYEADCYAAIEKSLAAVKGLSAAEQSEVSKSLAEIVGKNPNQAARIRELVPAPESLSDPRDTLGGLDFLPADHRQKAHSGDSATSCGCPLRFARCILPSGRMPTRSFS